MKRNKGFTLIELMTVIAIIGLLAAMLMPIYNKAKQKTHNTVCRNNLQQMGVMMSIYLNEFDGIYPYVDSMSDTKDFSYWFNALSSVSPGTKWNKGIFKCPAYKGTECDGGKSFDNRGNLLTVYSPCGSYAYNFTGKHNITFASGDEVSVEIVQAAGLGFTIFNDQPVEKPIKEVDVKDPSNLYALGDSPMNYATWYTNTTQTIAGSYNYNSLVGRNYTADQVQHSTSYNMLYADSHTENVKTSKLLDTSADGKRKWNHNNLP